MSFMFEDKQDFPDFLSQPLSERQSLRTVPPPSYGPCAYTRHVSSLPPPNTHTHTHNNNVCSQFAQQIAGMRFCEASAKDNFNVDEIFLKLVDDILKKVKKKKRKEKNPVSWQHIITWNLFIILFAFCGWESLM